MADPSTPAPNRQTPKAKSGFGAKMANLFARQPTLQDSPVLTDLSYRTRLLDTYYKMSAAKTLVADPPDLGSRPLDLESLRRSPALQSALAACTAYTPSKWLLEQELANRISNSSGAPPATQTESWSQSSGEDVYDAAAREGLAGLCFSGGGIRSATFCLGVMQALAASGKLAKFDYLSTVSGGGYIHQWLASWIIRESGGFPAVQQKLAPIPGQASLARAPEQITWLRRYSSYLTPQRGVFSADTWTMIAIWFRNTFLNQIVLVSFLASCLITVRVVSYPFYAPGLTQILGSANGAKVAATPLLPWVFGIALLFLAINSILLSCSRLWKALASVTAAVEVHQRHPDALDDKDVVLALVVPSFVFTLLVALESMGVLELIPGHHYPILLGLYGLYILGLNLATTFGGEAPREFLNLSRRGPKGKQARQTSFAFALVLSAVLCTAAGLSPAIAAAWLNLTPPRNVTHTVVISDLTNIIVDHVSHLFDKDSTSLVVQQEIRSGESGVSQFKLMAAGVKTTKTSSYDGIPQRVIGIVCPVLLLWLQFVAIRLQLGMIGRFYVESRREWLSRFGAWSAILCAVWILLSAIVLLGPPIFTWFFAGSVLRPALSSLAVLAVHAVTLYAGGSGKSDGKPKPNTYFGYSILDLVGMVGAPLCILALLIVISGVIDCGIQAICPYPQINAPVVLASLAIFAIFFLFGWRVDVNEFSMHGFYRNRLARCYLGATDRARTPDPFTHFDEHETGVRKGIPLSDLLPVKFGGIQHGDKKPYDGPFPIFCSTINLTFGQDLGWQERKGASFAFTPLFSGYHVGWTAETEANMATSFNGYVHTAEYAYPKPGIPLSLVTAISGAALSPNQGFSSNQALAFLMTLFNVRLGWWLANPRKPRVWPSQINSPTPSFGIRYLLNELFGLASDTSNYVCLCDGGRFENMGLYELVRRRCKLIVICDAEEDGDMVFEGMGNAIALCRTDFGAEIDINLSPLIPDEKTGLSTEHFRAGTITYPAPPGTPAGADARSRYTGTIVYLKSTVSQDMTGDILHHKRTNPNFPQDSTLNQWFSESQFESYRRLGQLVAETALPAI